MNHGKLQFGATSGTTFRLKSQLDTELLYQRPCL